MSCPTSRGQQVAVHLVMGFVPVLKIRYSVPAEGFGWEWGRWRMAKLSDVVALNSELLRTWVE